MTHGLFGSRRRRRRRWRLLRTPRLEKVGVLFFPPAAAAAAGGGTVAAATLEMITLTPTVFMPLVKYVAAFPRPGSQLSSGVLLQL